MFENATRPKPKEAVASALIPEELRGILPKPPLLRGESKEDYDQLLRLHIVERNPQGVSSWILLVEQVNKLWEYGRYERLARAIIDREMASQLAEGLGDLERFDKGIFSEDQIQRGAKAVALGMMRGDPEDEQALSTVLAKWGDSVETFAADAMLQRSKDVTWFKEQAQRARNEVRQLQRDMERHRFALTQRPQGRKEEDVSDVDFKEAALKSAISASAAPRRRRYRARSDGGVGNAFKHGLTSRQRFGHDVIRVEEVATALLRPAPRTVDAWDVACEAAEAHLEVLRLESKYVSALRTAEEDLQTYVVDQKVNDRLLRSLLTSFYKGGRRASFALQDYMWRSLRGPPRNNLRRHLELYTKIKETVVAFGRQTAAARARRRRALEALDRITGGCR